MAKKGGDIIFYLLGDDRKLRSALNNAKSHFNSVGADLLKVGAGVAGLIGITTALAAEAESAQAQLDAVLKSTGGAAGMAKDELNALASEMQRVTTFEDDAVTGAQSLLLTFTNIGKEVFPQATETVLDMSQALGQDLKSSSVQLGKALNDPIKGITALSRVGVSFTAQQKEQIKALAESGNLLGAQKIILAELSKEFGGSARAAAETFSGKLAQIKNSVGDLGEAIGFALIPALTPLIEQTKAWIETNGDEFAASLASALVMCANAAVTFLQVAGPMLPWLIAAAAAIKATLIIVELAKGVQMATAAWTAYAAARTAAAAADTAGAAASAAGGTGAAVAGSAAAGAGKGFLAGLGGKALTAGKFLATRALPTALATQAVLSTGQYLYDKSIDRAEADYQAGEGDFQKKQAAFNAQRAGVTINQNFAHGNVQPGSEAFAAARARTMLQPEPAI